MGWKRKALVLKHPPEIVFVCRRWSSPLVDVVVRGSGIPRRSRKDKKAADACVTPAAEIFWEKENGRPERVERPPGRLPSSERTAQAGTHPGRDDAIICALATIILHAPFPVWRP